MTFLKTTLTILLFWMPNLALAETIIQSAPEVASAVNTGDMILLDIRSEGEWKETGLAQGAWPVSMHTPEFGATLQKIFLKYDPSEVAIICATGGRTAYVAKLLAANGIRGVVDLSEGMVGNKRGPGWIARGMPTVSLPVAQAAFEQHY
jgi:rhodanese-related sulfurtransferase